MQQELTEDSLNVAIQILGVNQIGHESGNASICNGRTIPWLQETSASPVWTPWEVTWRDVVILDQENEVAGVFNLTQHNLADSANYATLRTLLTNLAQPSGSRSR